MRVPSSFLKANAAAKGKQPKYTTRAAAAVPEAMQDSLNTNTVDNLSVGEEVQDAEKDQSLIQRLDYDVWLPFAAKLYKISPKIEDYVIVNTLICPSDIPNRNGIGFPTSELVKFQPPPTNRQSFKAWTGCPVHLEHDNEVHERAYGVILDSSFHKVTGYGDGKLWKVMGLLAIDKQKNPDMAQKVLKKEINTYSMGALVDRFTCGFCGTECTSQRTCGHITGTGNVNWKQYKDYDGSSHLAFLNAHGISPIECSIVEDPAWAPALSDEVWDFQKGR